MSLTYTDIFCGAGGSSIGLSAAGLELRLAANHWERAIQTHSTNFPQADHLCADVSNYDMRRLPKTNVLWASPECTWHSPAGGRRKIRAQLDLLPDYVPTAAALRSRMTMVDVIRAAEVHRYDAVIVENVIEVADWELWDWWIQGMSRLGYNHQIVCVSSAHIGGSGNAPAPQWRDRLYVVFTRQGIRQPNLEPRPPAWCAACQADVWAIQSWKRLGNQVGKYGQQYVYRCPNSACRHQIVEPYVRPAAAAIDWSDLGVRIGDRDKPLAASTIERIRAGLRLFAQPITVAAAGGTYEREGSGYVRAWPALEAPLRTRTGTGGDAVACPPLVLNVNHGGDDGRPYPADQAPLSPRTTKIGDGLAVSEPFLTMLRANGQPRGLDEPMPALTTGRNHALTVPDGAFYVKNYGGNADAGDMVKPVSYPLSTITARDHHSLVIPYRRARAHTTAEPLHTLATRESAGLCSPDGVEVEIDDCRFRMLRPREHLRGQRFPDSYQVLGNQSEQTMQAGNAVSTNVAQWLAEQVAGVLA